MRNFVRFLRPMAFLRRKAIFAGVLGGNRKWLVWGGAAWFFHWVGRLFGGADPTPRYTAELSPGERVVVVHEPLSPLAVERAERRAAKQARKATKKAS